MCRRVVQQLQFSASEPVRAALARLGRTEDVRFSPANKLLVIAGFSRNCILVLSVRVETAPSGLNVTFDDFMELRSDCMKSLHGFDYIDENTLALANRDGLVSIIELPSRPLGGRCCEVAAIREVHGGRFTKVHTPGSVVVARRPWGGTELLVCNNYSHKVTRHVLGRGPKYRAWRNHTLLKRDLEIPDGIALSHDRRWIAVSNHEKSAIYVYDAATRLNRHSEPSAVLGKVSYPHGLRFTSDDTRIIAADAGAPLVHVYQRAGQGWHGDLEPCHSAVVLDEELYQRGRSSPEEGGPKGIDIDRSGRIVALTCEYQPLALFDLDELCPPPAS